jgi:hypothetical protein
MNDGPQPIHLTVSEQSEAGSSISQQRDERSLKKTRDFANRTIVSAA